MSLLSMKKDYEELATSVMSIVDCLVHKTKEKIESSTDVLKEILKPVVDEVEEVRWPPRDPEALKLMEKEINQREQEGQLDEGLLSEVNAQLRQAKEDVDKPGLEAMLQKVLQLYASRVLSKRSNAKKAPEEEWNKLLINGMTVGKGDISPDEFYAVIKKQIERTLIRTEGGSYQQRVFTEYLKGIQSRAEEIAQSQVPVHTTHNRRQLLESKNHQKSKPAKMTLPFKFLPHENLNKPKPAPAIRIYPAAPHEFFIPKPTEKPVTPPKPVTTIRACL
nr:hypothetical protein CFP56_74055 [Quercus suber]